MAAEIDAEMKRIIDEAYEKTHSILQDKREKLNQISSFLFEHEKMSGEEFENFFSDGGNESLGIHGFVDVPVV